MLATLITCGILEMLLWDSRVQIRPDAVTFNAGLAGFRRQYTPAPDETADITVANEFNQYYVVRVNAALGPPLTIAKRIKHRRAAESLANWLRERSPSRPKER